jgi:hypothetical protein
MPEPVPYDPAKYQARLNSTINPIEWVRIIGDAREQADRQNAAHAEAVRVIETYSASLDDTNAAMPAFTPPPKFGDGATGLTPGSPMPGGGTAGVVHQGDGAGSRAVGGGPGTAGGGSPTAPGTAVGGHGSGGAPPSSTPGQSVSYPPGIPGGGGPAGGSGGEPGRPSILPATAAVIGGAGPGERGSRAVGRRVGSAGGEFGPRGSGGLGVSNPLGRGGVGSTGAAGAGWGAAGLADHVAGAGSSFAPLAGAGRGRDKEDTEHRRPSYLIETEDIWGDGRRVAPPVIGEDPPEYHY